MPDNLNISTHQSDQGAADAQIAGSLDVRSSQRLSGAEAGAYSTITVQAGQVLEIVPDGVVSIGKLVLAGGAVKITADAQIKIAELINIDSATSPNLIAIGQDGAAGPNGQQGPPGANGAPGRPGANGAFGGAGGAGQDGTPSPTVTINIGAVSGTFTVLAGGGAGGSGGNGGNGGAGGNGTPPGNPGAGGSGGDGGDGGNGSTITVVCSAIAPGTVFVLEQNDNAGGMGGTGGSPGGQAGASGQRGTLATLNVVTV